MFEVNDYLRQAGLAPETTALCFHKPVERAFTRFLPSIAQQEPQLLEAYQCTHSDRAAALLRTCRHMASFIGLGDGRMLFEGLFEVGGAVMRPVSEIAAIPEIQRLYDDFGVCSEFFEGFSQSWLWFDLVRAPQLADLAARLIVARPETGGHMRRAGDLAVPVLALAGEPVAAQPVPDWPGIVLLAREVLTLPQTWAEPLAALQGVYLVTDETDGAQYVSATETGEDLLTCWRAHARGRRETAAGIRHRDPLHFRFSILELFGPGMVGTAAAELTESWIERLHTRQFGLNEIT